MASVNLKELVGRLNDTCRGALEGAAGLCLSRTNYNVEIEHWLVKLLEASRGDVPAILRACGIDSARLLSDLTTGIDRLRTGNARPPALSENVVDLMREAWLLASLEFGEQRIRSGHLLCALVSDDSLARLAAAASRQFEKLSAESLRKNLYAMTSGSDEAAEAHVLQGAVAEGAPEPGRPKGPTKTPALDQYTVDLTARARSGAIDPVLGRDSEIRQIMDILCRRRQNNPILTGEAGVGKTAVAEGFALRVASGDVPPPLRNVSVRSLDLGLLQAGAGVKGEFENRLKSVINEVKASPTPIIMFIDEAHTLIGAGGQAGQGDAANLLKPALARGELRTIAATTWAEYKKYFEKDAAMARRFQVVKVEEPAETSAVEMIRGLVETLEKHHQVRILSEAVHDSVRLSGRYISGRLLPDKAVALLDTTCARIGLSQAATPPAVEDCRRRIEQLRISLEILEREEAAGARHTERIGEIRQEQEALAAELKSLEERWQAERETVTAIHGLLQKLQGTAAPAPGAQGERPASEPLSADERNRLLADLHEHEEKLKRLQGENPLVHVCVNSQAIAETVASWTGIPVGRMVADEIKTVLNLEDLLEEVVVGQSHALKLISQSIRTSRANLTEPNRPIGVFLLAGTSGVGKTETAITLANLFYGGEQNMTVINMSEFKEEHKVSLLMGSPPGYVGYGEGGVLTEAVRRKPYSVLLLDEMEKAHPGVQDIFYQVFDKGTMKDGEGRDIDFRNTMIIMTSNAGTDLIKKLCKDPETRPDPDAFTAALFPELLKTFKPAFLGRLSVVPYYPLSDDVLKKIIRLKLGKIGRRVRENYRAAFSFSDDLVENVARRCTEVDTGARNVDHIFNKTLLPELSAEFLAYLAEGRGFQSVHVAVGKEGEFAYALS